MSVLIKGMKMPECCDVCRFGEWSTLHQTACCKLKEHEPCFAEFSKEYRSKRADFCPLVALPDHHGRLVEFIDVVKTLDEDSGTKEVCFGDIMRAYYEMRNAPTIVEKEDGE